MFVERIRNTFWSPGKQKMGEDAGMEQPVRDSTALGYCQLYNWGTLSAITHKLVIYSPNEGLNGRTCNLV